MSLLGPAQHAQMAMARGRGKIAFGYLQNCKSVFAPDLLEQTILQNNFHQSDLLRASQQIWFDIMATDTMPCTSKWSQCKSADEIFAATLAVAA